MANEDLRVRIEAQIKGLDQVESLKNAVRQLQNTAAPASADLERLKKAAIDLGSATDRTESDLRRSISALKDVRAQLSLTDREYRQLTGTINKYQAQLDKATGAQQRSGRGMQFAQTAGAVAASGVFGGPEGLIGAGIGAFFGPGGALAGGAIGAEVGMIRQQLGQVATLAADLEKQRIALRLVLKDTAEYDSALQFLKKTSEQYAIPQDRLIKGFTQLAASVAGAGGNINDTKIAFEGVTAGIRGTGRSLEDLDSALLATAQVFSKGKVTAEELRGQIGERLPGAFTLFAQSLGKTPQELDKALERGEVSLQDFLTFAKTVFGEYGENAKIIADSPAAAGDRLQTNLKNLGESVGKLLQPIGASFQDTFSGIVKYIDEAARKLADFLGLNRSNAEKVGDLNNTIITQQKAIERERRKLSQGLVSREAADYSIRLFQERIAKARGELGVLRALDKASENQQRDRSRGLSGTSPKGDLDTEALKSAERRRQQEAAQQQLTDERLAKAKIALDDNIHRNAMELVRKRYEYEQELANKQRDNWVKGLTGGARTAATLVSQFMGELTDLQNRTLQAMQDVTDAQQKVQSMRAMADVTAGGPTATTPTGGSAIFGATGRVRNAPGWVHGHFQTNVGTLADLIGDVVPVVRQLMQQGIPVELSGGQRFRTGMSDAEIRNLLRVAASQHGHSGDGRSIDLFVPQGTNVPVPLSDVRNTGGRGGVTGMLPGSGRSWIGHLDPRSRSGGGTSAAARRDIAAEGSADIAVAEANKAKEALKLLQDQLSKLAPEAVKGFVLNLTDELRVQNAAMEDSAKITALRNRLQLEGARPEVIDSEVKKAEATQQTSQSLTVLQAMLTAAKTKLDELKAANQENTQEGINAKSQVDAYSQGIAELNFNLSENKRLTDEATAAQIAFNDAMRFRQDMRIGEGIRDGAQQYVESIGTMREATAQLAQNGIKGVEDAIFSLVTTGTANFKEFAAEILKQTTRMIIQQLILRSIMQIIGAIPGGGGGGSFGKGYFDPITGKGAAGPNFGLAMGGVIDRNGLQPFAMGGIVTKPTLFKFANGGIPRTGLMGEAGPEAIIPLRRGRDGRLGVAGGGNSTNVTVNVDASGSSVQGNAGQGEALGQVISQAVQQELIKQRRPGGLLAA